MTTKTNICNRALLVLGESPVVNIDDQNDQRVPVVACREMFDDAVGEVLQRGQFNCSIKRQAMSLSSNPVPYEYKYRALLPPDCLKIIQCITSFGEDVSMWARENEYIVSGDKTFEMEYVFLNTNPVQWPPLVRNAIVYNLAMMVSTAITSSQATMSNLFTLYSEAMKSALTADGAEKVGDKVQTWRKQVDIDRFGGNASYEWLLW